MIYFFMIKVVSTSIYLVGFIPETGIFIRLTWWNLALTGDKSDYEREAH